MPCCRMPGSNVMRLRKLRTNSSARDEQHERDRNLGHHHQALNGETLAPGRHRAAADLHRRSRAECASTRSAGAMPKTRQVAWRRPAVNSSIRQSVASVSVGALPSAASARTSTRLRNWASRCRAPRRTPTAAAFGQESAAPAVVREAPSARRTANSCWRATRAREHQVRQVGAGDQQHETGDRQQQLQRGVVLRAEPLTPVDRGYAARRNRLNRSIESVPYPVGAAASKMPALSAVDVRRRALERPARAQTSP